MPRSASRRPPTTVRPDRTPPEHDACGIGFVADEAGRSSHALLRTALDGLAGVQHRGAVAADGTSADGCGLLVPLDRHRFGPAGVAMLFVRGADPRPAVQDALVAEGRTLVDWRPVPVEPAALGPLARATRPGIVQAVFDAPTNPDERAALRIRRRIERGAPGTYVASCSFRTVVYKSLAPATALAAFYPDLDDPDYAVHFAVFHQRFSTNTRSTWERAQPFRTLCHNGEINAIAGNEAHLASRGRLGTEEAGLGDEELLWPVLDPATSDSGKLDALVELLTRAGRDVRHAMAMVVPEAWEDDRAMDPALRGFYRYHASLMEAWDGPAGVVFTDGTGVGARLDRNGLRPLRYLRCADGLIACASEVGAIDVTGRGPVVRGRLGPGQMLFVDPTRGLLGPAECRDRLAAAGPYARWAADGLYHLSPGEPVLDPPGDLLARQAAHGYTREELAMVLRPMVDDAYEPTFAMGDDSPLPHLAARPRPVHHYLKQRFAQVTNPPIDPIRERSVMSLRTLLGPRQPILSEVPAAARMLELPSFFLFPSGVEVLHLTDRAPYPVVPLDATFAIAEGPGGLAAALDRLVSETLDAVRGGAGIVILDDEAVGPTRAPVPSLLGVGAVHHGLIEHRLRSATSLVVVSDSARDVHEVATLLGYGADAVCPRLALQTVAHTADSADDAELVSPEAQVRLQAALEAGVLKVMSKMGIATLDSYRGAQLFEAVGLGPDVIERCLPGTVSVVGGVTLEHLGQDVLRRHAAAWPRAELDSPGWIRVRKGGEYHAHDKGVVDALTALTIVHEPDPADREVAAAHLLQRAIAGGTHDGYQRFADLVDERPPIELHDLLEAVPAGPPVPLDEVEPAGAVLARFSTGAMSHGALSKEAHETLAQAMNLIGGRSNCGEGGEDPARYRTRGRGRDDRNSRIKQIASGRFGVTPEYLAFADELQIKMAQGSKPGEGGQLPGHKVSPEIARLRHTQPGVGLISPPPHHDIYSIEDLAQLVFDLKQVNGAEVSVKLVAVEGVGTIAAGVVKALADVVHLSGHNGGTGASPLSSIKHAGLPWELGLAETQQVLMANGLRDRVRLRVDGGFKTGRQVIVAALLGADEFSFGTAAMIAEGCIMLRACHRDTCKPGVATQRPNLRANFAGTPEGVAAYFCFVAEDVRRRLASLGLRSLDEAVGRVELLRQRRLGDDRIDSVDLSPLLGVATPDTPHTPDDPVRAPRRFVARAAVQDPRGALGDRLRDEAFRAVWDGDDVDLCYEIGNADRAVGAALAGAIALEYGSQPPRGTARVHLRGSAGQSFGAFCTHGVELDLTGEANDYVGKGMAGGSIVIRAPDDDASPVPVLAGNTCLYGATGGELFVAGAVGERFAVRNSGAVAVVEGAGDHCCEYMTGGTVVVLGPVGANLGAGMTGGQAFVWDPHLERLVARLNTDLVEAMRPATDAIEEVRWLVERHCERTGSVRAAELVKVWDLAVEQLWHVVPRGQVRRIGDLAARRVASV